MRGEIVAFDAGVGEGEMAGDDFARYRFKAADARSPALLRTGARVEFLAFGGQALEISLLAGSAPPVDTKGHFDLGRVIVMDRYKLIYNVTWQLPYQPVDFNLDNVKALDVRLTSDEVVKLDALTQPTFGFPQSMQPIFPAIHNGGTRVNGVQMPPSGFGLVKGEQPY